LLEKFLDRFVFLDNKLLKHPLVGFLPVKKGFMNHMALVVNMERGRDGFTIKPSEREMTSSFRSDSPWLSSSMLDRILPKEEGEVRNHSKVLANVAVVSKITRVEGQRLPRKRELMMFTCRRSMGKESE